MFEEESSYMSISKKIFYSLASECSSACSITYFAKDSNSCSSSGSYSSFSPGVLPTGVSPGVVYLKSAKKSIPSRTLKGYGESSFSFY